MAARLPGVYVTVEDRSYVEDQVSSGRSGLIVILSDRGPHNTVVRVTSNARFFQQYGKPVLDRTGQAHYIASQFLRRSNQLYVIRAALLDSPIPSHNCALANVAIRYTPTEGGTEEILSGNFIFTAAGPVDLDGAGPLDPIYLGQWDEDNAYNVFGSAFISQYVFCNYIGFEGVNIDDFISIDGSYESIQVIDKGRIPLYDEKTGIGQGAHEGSRIYYLKLASPYTGRSTETDLGQLPIKLKEPYKSQVEPLIIERDKVIRTPPLRVAEINAEIDILEVELYGTVGGGILPTQDRVVEIKGLINTLLAERNADPAPTAERIAEIDLQIRALMIELYANVDAPTVERAAEIEAQIETLIEERDAVITTSPERIAEINAIIEPLVSNLNHYTYLLYDSRFINEDTRFRKASKFYFGPKIIKFRDQYDIETFYPTCAFTKGSNIVICGPGEDEYGNTLIKNEKTFESIYQEEWIMSDNDYRKGIASNSETQPILRQIIEKVIETPEGGRGRDVFKFILNAPYEGESTPIDSDGNYIWDRMYTHVPVQVVSSKNIRSADDFNTNDIYNIFYFYAEGVGSYYNNILLQGVRNYQLEKMYTDDNGVPLYKYIFMDLTIFGENEDGSTTILEGPWTVSLVNKVGDQVVRDLNTGRELYIVNTINERSEYIKCKEGINASILEGLTKEKEELRLKVMALFSVSFVYRTRTSGQEGFFLENGNDGIQYDVFGRLNINNAEISQLVRNAYATDLKSTDGSIQLLMQTLYPWYLLDYVISGGYNVDIQSAARELVDTRKDCLLLADTGEYKLNATEELRARSLDVPWNTWNAMLYTQYRTITDPYSGKQITISPVYHAIERHLTVDNNYFMSEPVAGIEKGALQERAVLAYKPSLADMEEMIDVELNPTITEPDGTYFLTQFTTYKRASVMKRAHAVKIVQHLQKRLPSILKDLLQRKGTPYWVSVAESRVDTFMKQFTNANTPKHSFKSYNIDLNWDEERSEIYIGLTVKPLRAIEAIHVNIIVT